MAAARRYRLRQSRPYNRKKKSWRAWLKKNTLIISLVVSVSMNLGGIAATLISARWTNPRLDEDVRIQLRQMEKFELMQEGRVKLTAEFYISNAANLNITITNLYCSNTQLNWLQWFYRPCRIVFRDESIPLTIEAGKVHSIKAELDIEPGPIAERVLRKALSLDMTDTYEVAQELAKNQIDLFDRPVKYQDGMPYSYNIESGRKLGIRDIFSDTGQGYELTVFTSRGLEVRSAFYGVLFPLTGR